MNSFTWRPTPLSPEWEDNVKSTLRGISIWIGILLILTALSNCGGGSDSGYDSTFRILSGTENQSLEPIIQSFARDENTKIEITYAGSVDIMRELANGVQSKYDAVWPASSIWIQLGDTTHAVQFPSSIMRSPVVLAVKHSVATRLNWINAEVTVNDVLSASESGQLTFMMANASQSDSGAAAYLGFLYAFAGQPDVLTSANLQDPAVRDKTTRILGQVSRTAASSGSLKDLFVSEFDAYDGMINYESAVIEANQTLVGANREPLYVIYLRDGTSIADFPLGYISKGDARKQELFLALQAHLQSDDVVRKLLALGRRAWISLNPDPAIVDSAVFNPAWGIDTQRILTPVRVPEAPVVLEALNLFQTMFRKPSLTVFALDFSGSMTNESDGADRLIAAMHMLLDQTEAAKYFLGAAPNDVTVVIPFDDEILDTWIVAGNDPAALQQLDLKIAGIRGGGGTDIYSPVIQAIDYVTSHGADGFFVSIVLLTDGMSKSGRSYQDLETYIDQNHPLAVPVYAITFGKASPEQLQEIAELTGGSVFDGRTDLAGTFREVRGYT